jgi:outer membrane protein TolC
VLRLNDRSPGGLPPRVLLCWGVAASLLGGCVAQHLPPAPLDPAAIAASLDGRTLHDEGLRRFLADNLQQAPTPWPKTSWDFETLSWVAFYYHPSLGLTRAQWETARAAVTTAGARPNPTLSLAPGYNTNPDAGVSPWFPAVSLDFLISTAHKGDQHVVAWKARRDLRQALSDWDAAQKKSTLLEAQEETQWRVLELMDQRLQSGTISQAEVAGTRIALARAESQAAEARQQLPTARQHVAQALGLPVGALPEKGLAAAPSASSLTAPQLTAARRLALQSRSEVRAALARYAASEAALAEELAKQYPDLHLGPGYQWDQGADKWSLALTFELPVFNRNQGPIAEAAARRQEAAAEFLSIQAGIIAEIDGAAADQTAAADHLARLARVQTELQRQLSSLKARLGAGAADQLEVRTAELDLSAGELAQLDAESQAAAAAGRLEDALQIPFAHLETLIVPARLGANASPP